MTLRWPDNSIITHLTRLHSTASYGKLSTVSRSVSRRCHAASDVSARRDGADHLDTHENLSLFRPPSNMRSLFGAGASMLLATGQALLTLAYPRVRWIRQADVA